MYYSQMQRGIYSTNVEISEISYISIFNFSFLLKITKIFFNIPYWNLNINMFLTLSILNMKFGTFRNLSVKDFKKHFTLKFSNSSIYFLYDLRPDIEIKKKMKQEYLFLFSFFNFIFFWKPNWGLEKRNRKTVWNLCGKFQICF